MFKCQGCRKKSQNDESPLTVPPLAGADAWADRLEALGPHHQQQAQDAPPHLAPPHLLITKPSPSLLFSSFPLTEVPFPRTHHLITILVPSRGAARHPQGL